MKDDWHSSDIVFTDENGCWQINERYSKKAWMWIKFQNATVNVRDRRFKLAIKPVRDYAGRIDHPPFSNINVAYGASLSDNESNARMYWAAAHTLNVIYDYRISAAADGVPLPRMGLNWTNFSSDQNAAAPMLQGNIINSWPSFGLALLYPYFYFPAVPLLPDVTNPYDVNESAVAYTATAYHELGHASHYSLVDEGYWYEYRNHIINNGGYGSFGNFDNVGSNPGHVALGEAVATYIHRNGWRRRR